MTKRVLFSNNKLRISIPGVEVDNAGLDQLILHEAMRPFYPLISGMVYVGASTYTPAGNPRYDDKSQFIDLPTTMIRPWTAIFIGTPPSGDNVQQPGLTTNDGMRYYIVNPASVGMTISYTIFEVP